MTAWNTVKLSEVCEIQRGGSPRPIEQFMTEDANGVNWIKIGDVAEGAKYITSTREKIRPEGVQRSREVSYGDFLLSNSMSFGRPYILRTSGCIHDGWLVLRYDKTKLTEDFLYHVLSSDFVYAQFVKFAVGAVVKNLNSDIVKNVSITLPPLPEQRRIAAILDQADALRAKRREALAHLDALTQSIFIEMFGDPATNPKGWPIRKIGELLESASYGTSEKSAAEGQFPVLRMNNITRTGEIDLTDLKYMNLDEDEYDRYLVRTGDVLFNRTNSADLVGKTAIYRHTETVAYAGYLIRLRANTENDPEYLGRFLNSAYAKRMLRGMCKSIIGMANINATEIQAMKIAQPPTSVQREFGKRVRAVEHVKARHRESLAELDTLFASLQHRAFRGEL
ncbi:MAG: restriction endonuclease subunit S [Casimicrobium sp.]